MIKKVLFAFLTLLMLSSLIVGKYYSLIYREEEEKVKVIVVENNNGRLANQLWHFAHLIAYCKEKNYELFNPAFFHYAKDFEHFKYDLAISPTTPFTIFLPCMQELQRRGHRILAYLKKGKLPENHHYFDKEPRVPLPPTVTSFPDLSFGNHYFFDWLFDNPTGLTKYREEIMELLKPNKAHRKKIEAFWKNIDKNRLNVGVHIRHGDFKVWNGGASFYSIEKVKEKMKEVATRYQALNPQFIIYSDEHRESGEFEGFDVILANGDFIEDLYSMARCDLILGVGASTYNAWAAWYGNVPRMIYEQAPDWEALDKILQQKAINSEVVASN